VLNPPTGRRFPRLTVDVWGFSRSAFVSNPLVASSAPRVNKNARRPRKRLSDIGTALHGQRTYLCLRSDPREPFTSC
jgi:hypothetical protein